MTILAINAYHADSSAAIFVHGKLIAASEEERFTRIKHWAGFPAKAIQFCLDEAGLSLETVDHLVIGRDPNAKFGQKILFLLSNPWGGFKTIKKRFLNSKDIGSIEEEFSKMSGIKPEQLKARISHIEHHRSHLASAFFASPYDEAALLSIDGSGDFTTTMIATGKGNQITVLDSVDFPVSIGTFYTAFTQLLGFPHYGDEYKIMGLAPYGEPKYAGKVRKVIWGTSDGLFKWNKKYFKSAKDVAVGYGADHVPFIEPLFSAFMEHEFGQARKPADELTAYHKDLAASVQLVTEELIIHLAQSLYLRTGIKNLCLAGGVAQNSVANGKIILNTGFESLFVPPAGHDAGISTGAGLYQYYHIGQSPRKPGVTSAYTGSRYTNQEIEELLKLRKIDYSRVEDAELNDRVSTALVNGSVIGWFQGRAEFGPRALGARSILADPRRADAKELINSKIKRRESFRPFAPSILKEYVGEYFESCEPVPFMEKVYPIWAEKRSGIPAVTHVDGTGRLQTVDSEVSPRYYALIDCFREKTGVPILLNTSFNENEPIVNTPEEALNCFLRTEMDMLVMENIVIVR